jgi:hypothetical protein
MATSEGQFNQSRLTRTAIFTAMAPILLGNKETNEFQNNDSAAREITAE